MSPDEIQQLVQALNAQATTPLWPQYLLAAATVGLLSFLGAYIAEKAKNSAIKEDIRAITQNIEEIKSEYAQRAESLKGTYHLRAIALEKRLAILQEAFIQWRKIIDAMHTSEIFTVTHECSKWWTANCVYLPVNVRDQFTAAIRAARHHANLLSTMRDVDKIEENWNRITIVGDTIMKCADLPALPSETIQDLKNEKGA